MLYIAGMYFKNVMFSAFLLSSLCCLAQKKTTLLKEDFSDNKNGWKLRNDSSFRVDIDKGVLHLEKFIKNGIDKGCLWYRKEIAGFNTLHDFSITVYAKILYADDIVDMFDIQWGTWDKTISGFATSIYQLNFMHKRGDIKLDYFNKKWDYSLRKAAKEMADRNLYKPGEMNKYEVIQESNYIIFKINDQQYFKQFITPIAGTTIGFQQCLRSAWEIDKIIVKQQKKDVAIASTEKQPMIVADTTKAQPQNDIKISAYPNPFTDEVNIQFYAEKESNVKIDVFDIQGMAALQYTTRVMAGEQRVRLYADIAPGAYIVKLTLGDKTASVKVVKQ